METVIKIIELSASVNLKCNNYMKTTPFTDVHIALGAKMHEFAGFNMPIEYSGIIDEHMTVVNGVGVFDVSHWASFG